MSEEVDEVYFVLSGHRSPALTYVLGSVLIKFTLVTL